MMNWSFNLYYVLGVTCDVLEIVHMRGGGVKTKSYNPVSDQQNETPSMDPRWGLSMTNL